MSTFTYNLPDEAIQFEPRPRAEGGAQCTLKISVGPSRDGLLWNVNNKAIGISAQMAAGVRRDAAGDGEGGEQAVN